MLQNQQYKAGNHYQLKDQRHSLKKSYYCRHLDEIIQTDKLFKAKASCKVKQASAWYLSYQVKYSMINFEISVHVESD